MTSRNVKSIFAILAASLSVKAQYTATYDPSNLPPTTEQGQTGTNECGTANNQTGLCQNLYLNSIQDFCVWGPPDPNSAIGVVEQIVVAYCNKAGRGTRLFPPGTFQSVHFIETPDYIQVTGTGDFTKINIAAGDVGGELDPHGADGNGNPHGGLVFSNVWTGGTGLGQQIHEWTNFMSDAQFCIRVCKEGTPGAPTNCNHIYDTMGCEWNMPGNYGDGFDFCLANSVIPMGLYPQGDGSTSTFNQGDAATPAGQPAAATSSCTNFTSNAVFAAATSTSTGAATATIAVTSHPTSSAPAHTGGATRLTALPSFSFLAVILGAITFNGL